MSPGAREQEKDSTNAHSKRCPGRVEKTSSSASSELMLQLVSAGTFPLFFLPHLQHLTMSSFNSLQMKFLSVFVNSHVVFHAHPMLCFSTCHTLAWQKLLLKLNVHLTLITATLSQAIPSSYPDYSNTFSCTSISLPFAMCSCESLLVCLFLYCSLLTPNFMLASFAPLPFVPEFKDWTLWALQRKC